MYSICVMLTKKPKDAFRLDLNEMIALVEEGIGSAGHFLAFFEYVSDWQKIREDPEYVREAFKEGIQALDEIVWWRRD